MSHFSLGRFSRARFSWPSCPPEGTSEYPSAALLGAPLVHGRGRQSPDQAQDMAAELASWTSGELPGQVTEQLAPWPVGMPSAPDQTRRTRVTSPLSCRASSTFT